MSASSWLTNLGTCSANSYICCTACPHCHGSQTGVPAMQTVTSVVQHVCIIMAHKLGYLQTVMPVHHSCTTMVPIFRHVLIVMHHYTGIPVLWHHSTLVPQYTGVTAHWYYTTLLYVTVHWCHSTLMLHHTVVCHSTLVSQHTGATVHWSHSTDAAHYPGIRVHWCHSMLVS